MRSADARTHVDHADFYRGILGIAAVAVPLFGLVQWGVGYDSFAVRLGFSGASFALVAASYASAAVRRHLRLGLLIVCHALFAWFAYVGFRHNMTLQDLIGQLPVILGFAVVIRRTGEIVFSIAYVTIVLAIAYGFLDAPEVDLSVPVAVCAVFAGIVGWMSAWRSRLEEALQVANATLELRVSDRTALLMRECAERVAAERRSSAASEAKSRFLANMSHELRTPLNAVIGYTELVEQELAETDQAHHCADLEKVGRAARHLLSIIDDILDLSRIEAGSLALRQEPVRVREVVDDAAVLIQPAIDARGNRLTLAAAPELAVLGDRQALLRVLLHLLDNAAKFTAAGTIAVAAAQVGESIEIEVRDTGIGIPESARQHIFQRFTQVDDSSTRAHGGAGLGLALCKELVTRMGGALSVTSAVGEGSAFTVRLPAA